MKRKNVIKGTALSVLAALMLTACGGGDAYNEYSTAYKKVTANGGMDADFDVTLSMDGTTSNCTGNFKLDTSDGSNILYYEMNFDDSKVIQFSDGTYLYSESDGQKTRYSLNAKPATSGNQQKMERKESASSDGFNTAEFLNEFSSFLEAGKIKEMGLLSPMEKAAVTNVSESGGVYTLEFSDNLVKKYLNIMIENETQSSGSDTLKIDEMKDFSYQATVSGDIVTKVSYSGTIQVCVPASLMASGEETTYDMDFDIQITFVNPGSAVSITLPSTDGYMDL
ncbi:MAG: hypothetical protein NC337_14015 [Roseburia sp.]|nr:hypothetical protein [Roseburia sp.]